MAQPRRTQPNFQPRLRPHTLVDEAGLPGPPLPREAPRVPAPVRRQHAVRVRVRHHIQPVATITDDRAERGRELHPVVLSQLTWPLHADPERCSDGAVGAVRSHDVRRSQVLARSMARLQAHGDPLSVRAETDELDAPPYGHRRSLEEQFVQQRLNPALGDPCWRCGGQPPQQIVVGETERHLCPLLGSERRRYPGPEPDVGGLRTHTLLEAPAAQQLHGPGAEGQRPRHRRELVPLVDQQHVDVVSREHD